ncbi:MAG: ATP-binding protein [Candidatus Hodarchaeota archaeon]
MEVIRSSTSEITFLIDVTKALINEQDFILISDSTITPSKQYLAQVSNLVQQKDNEIKGTASILGEINLEDSTLEPCRFPIALNAQISQPPRGLVSKIISYRGEQGIYLGDVITSDKQKEPFLISPNFLERHVLCVASTGAGKSYTVGVLLEEILMKFKSAAVLLFDIHNEYWGLAQPNDGSEIDYLNFENYTPRGFIENILLFEEGSLGLGKQFDLPKLRRLIELTPAQENSLLNIIKEPLGLEELVSRIQDSNIHTSTRENLISKIHSLNNLDLFNKDLDFHALIVPGQISIIRLDQFTDERRRNLLVNEVLAQLFEKKLQGEISREHEIVVIIEEAHRFAASTEILPQIAREGRKFGLYEILISQRPGDLPDNIIANMNTLIALRIKSDKDINKIRLMEGISIDTVSVLPHLTRGEALIVGLQGSTHRPIKISVRPRLSKHVDPQEDIMINNISRYGYLLNQKADSAEIDTLEVNDIHQEKDIPSIDSELFDFRDLTNLLSCQHILVLHKTSGICLYGIGVTMFKIDPQLVSGFLSAISGLFSELKSQDIVKGRTILRMFREEIGDRSFEIITVEGAYSATAIVLDRTPKYLARLKKKLRNFVYAFEIEFNEYLRRFSGVLDDFDSTAQLLDKHLGLALTTPLQINPNYRKDNISSDIDIFEIISREIDQLARGEGLFIEEIVNKCILDSNYNYREIIEAIISFLQQGILILVDQKRLLPSLSSQLLLDYEKEKKREKEELEVDLAQEMPTDIELKDDLERSFEEIDEINIEWFTEILTEITETTLPDSIKQDILARDIMFESKFRIKSSSVRTEVFSKSDLIRWAQLMTQKGFILQDKTKNPLNGLKITMKADFISIVSSIALLKNGDFLTILAEVE